MRYGYVVISVVTVGLCVFAGNHQESEKREENKRTNPVIPSNERGERAFYRNRLFVTCEGIGIKIKSEPTHDAQFENFEQKFAIERPIRLPNIPGTVIQTSTFDGKETRITDENTGETKVAFESVTDGTLVFYRTAEGNARVSYERPNANPVSYPCKPYLVTCETRDRSRPSYFLKIRPQKIRHMTAFEIEMEKTDVDIPGGNALLAGTGKLKSNSMRLRFGEDPSSSKKVTLGGHLQITYSKKDRQFMGAITEKGSRRQRLLYCQMGF